MSLATDRSLRRLQGAIGCRHRDIAAAICAESSPAMNVAAAVSFGLHAFALGMK